MVLVQPAHGDADNIQLLFSQHPVIVLVAIGGVDIEALAGRGQSVGIGVGDGNQFDLLHAQVDDIQAVAVVAAPGVADDTGSIRCHVNSSLLVI